MLRTLHLETGEQAREDEKRRVGDPSSYSTRTSGFFLFLFMATSETRDGARRRACSKLSYSPPYNQAENPEGSLALPATADDLRWGVVDHFPTPGFSLCPEALYCTE